MSDQPNRTDADAALDILLVAHADELRKAVGASISTETGLANLRSLGQSSSPGHDDLKPNPEPEESAEGGSRLRGRRVAGRRTRDPNTAVRWLIKDLGDEAAHTRALSDKLARMTGEERRSFGRTRHALAVTTLRLNAERFRMLGQQFECRTELNHAQVLDWLQDYQQELETILGDFKAEAVKHQRETAPHVRRWEGRVQLLVRRAERLQRLRADIAWIFDGSEDLQEVLS